MQEAEARFSHSGWEIASAFLWHPQHSLARNLKRQRKAAHISRIEYARECGHVFDVHPEAEC